MQRSQEVTNINTLAALRTSAVDERNFSTKDKNHTEHLMVFIKLKIST